MGNQGHSHRNGDACSTQSSVSNRPTDQISCGASSTQNTAQSKYDTGPSNIVRVLLESPAVVIFVLGREVKRMGPAGWSIYGPPRKLRQSAFPPASPLSDLTYLQPRLVSRQTYAGNKTLTGSAEKKSLKPCRSAVPWNQTNGANSARSIVGYCKRWRYGPVQRSHRSSILLQRLMMRLFRLKVSYLYNIYSTYLPWVDMRLRS